jgi:hypothetical protein
MPILPMETRAEDANEQRPRASPGVPPSAFGESEPAPSTDVVRHGRECSQTVMRKYDPPPADYSSRDSLFLLAIAVVSLVCGAVSFFLWRAEHNPSLSASMEDSHHVPLPAGPRKYQ